MRLGIFGGSFDPVHLGHLLLADCCLQQAKLDEVRFLPTAHQPLKPQGPQASNAHRLAMLQLACQDRREFVVSTRELDRGGISYTVDTLSAIHDEQPDAQLFFLMGADSLADLPAWHRPADICRLAVPLVVHRAESPQPDFGVLAALVDDQRLALIRQHRVEMPPTPISSSQIRASIAAAGAGGASSDGAKAIDAQTRDAQTPDPRAAWQSSVPPAVADYIRRHRLYRSER